MAKKIDPKAKAKKQKVIAAVGGVLLLGLLAFQVPRTMKMLNPPVEESSTPAPSTSTTGSTTDPLVAPSLSGGNATAAVAPGGDGITDPDAVPAAQSGQLLAFGRFRTKDPFAQQLNATCDAEGGCSSGGTGAKGSTGAKGVKPATGDTGGPKSGTPPQVAVVPTTAVIAVNGDSETVTVAAQFPADDPIFTLVSVTAKTAKVGIAGGSLESGKATVTLRKNKPVTLLNTADGTRYVLRLLSVT